MLNLSDLKIQIYADGADKAGILDLYAKPYIKGLTTNPTLMNKAGIKDYEAFARDILQTVTTKPISLEVFADDFPEMKRQALKIASWGKNVYVKIPITNTRSESSIPLIKELAIAGVHLCYAAFRKTARRAPSADAYRQKVSIGAQIYGMRVRVSFGEQSWEEMMIGFFDVAIDASTDPADVMRPRRKVVAANE